MKKALLAAVWAMLGTSAWAQSYGNEWIHYDRPYWSFKVWQDGIRRIDSTTLANAGFSLADVDPRTIEVFARGRQVPLYVNGENDGTFNNGDYLEFWGAKNDDWLDSTLWDSPDHINNPYYSLYNDTIRYYISWGPPGEALRMAQNGSTAWGSHSSLPWCWTTTLLTYPLLYQAGSRTPQDVSSTNIGEGEGYFRNAIIAANGADFTQTQVLPITSLYQGSDAPASTYRLVLASLNSPSGGQFNDHHLRVSHAGTVLADTAFTGYKLLKYDFSLPASTLGLPNASVDITVVHDLTWPNYDPAYPDASALSWQSIRYPRDFAFAALTTANVEVPALPGDSSLMTFTSAPGPVVYAWASNGMHRVAAVNSSGNIFQAVLPPSAQDMRVFVARPASILPVTAITKVSASGLFTFPGQNLTDSALVIVTHPKLMDAVMQYAAYRQSNPYNRYNTIVADVQQLYDQFGGGVWQHPLAIRRYLRYVYDHAPSHPKALFLIGKSVKAPATGTGDANRGYRMDQLASAACLVPTIGWPSSDMSYGLNLEGNNPSEVSVPVGRLAARSPVDVLDYLAKVDSTESQPPAAWMKNILHFRGGFTQAEWNQFNLALQSFQDVAEDTSFFGHVTKFSKNGGGIIETAAADSVTDLIAHGVTLMTFFAHAYGGGFDITIDTPSNYDWHGKFPTIIGNSCYTGDIHYFDGTSASEQFVLQPNAGAIAFLSSVDVGLANYLQNYTLNFYRSFSQVNYGKSIGEHMRYAAHGQLAAGDLLSVNSAETMTLHGDPTIVMNSPGKPDLDITQNDITTIPATVTADVDSFRVRAIIRNIGRGTHIPFSVALQRTVIGENLLLPPVIHLHVMQHYQDTVYFTLPTHAGIGGQGLNNLQVRVDLDPDVIPEIQDHTNNSATLQISIGSGDLLPVEPYNFAIVPTGTPMLKASTGDPFAAPHTYIFQIDTTDLYNSPVMEQHSVVAPGGVVQWLPTSIYALNSQHDSLVYYWRCTLDSLGQGGYNWHEFSFQHLTGRQGWGQSHFFQFKDDAFNQITYNRPQRKFDYFNGPHYISCEVKGNSYYQVFWNKDLDKQEGEGCGTQPALMVGVVDPFDFSTWLTRYGGVGRYYGNYNDNGVCLPRQKRVFSFRQTVHAELNSCANMLTTAIPDGDFVLVYTYVKLLRDSVANSGAMAALHALGANHLFNGDVPDNVPYIFFCRKGDLSTVQEVWGDTLTSLIDMDAVFNIHAHSGTMDAPRSSQALSWTGLSWRMDPRPPYDSARIDLAGVTPQGNEHPLLDLPGYSGNIDLQPLITAQQYPQLRLSGRFWNDSLSAPVPSQLKRWQLLGVPAPECAIDPPAGYYAHFDSLFQGQQAAVMVSVRNIGQVPMDSLLMSAIVTDHNGQHRLIHYKRKAPLPVGAVLQDTIRFDTQGFPGPNSIVIEANPIDTITGLYDQPEQYHFNNIATLRFLTNTDRQNPVLDVTFDGIHILDGDIVSAKPEIQVTLDDENTVLLLDQPTDTALFKVFLTDPSGTVKQIYFRQGGQQVLQFVPANSPANISKIFYRPVFAQDGIYQLAVRATDKSRNNSGDHDNSIKFEVINKPTITEVLNYPNPFTTSTRFVFTLTGSEVPTAMRIQIMTVTGRVVREVPMAELGRLHVGRNITDFAWDGTDQFGDRLARGVYLYHVIAQLHGQDIEYRETSAGSYFTKGFGKMYLLR